MADYTFGGEQFEAAGQHDRWCLVSIRFQVAFVQLGPQFA